MLRYAPFIIVFAILYWIFFVKSPDDQPLGKPVAHDMSEAERDYYDQIFSYTMNSVKAGTPYKWQSYNAQGSITPGAPFASKSKAVCREYSETVAIGGGNYDGKGIGCRREGRDGWCKLKKNDAATTCAMESLESPLSKGARRAAQQGEHMVDSLSGHGSSGGGGEDGGTTSLPGISGPNLPSIDMPNIKKPKFDNVHIPMPWEAGTEKKY